MDEFETIARLFRPLTGGAPEALGLMDDAAVIPSRPGFDLVITKDALVEGVHFLPDDPPGQVAQKALRMNLSDLAAKAAEPYAYFLAVAWSPGWDEGRRKAFAAGLAEDQNRFGIRLFGGDTVSTPGPFTLSMTLLGWTPSGRMVRRSGAKAGDVVLISGTIGDGHLGLSVARGDDLELSDPARRFLEGRYRLPSPRLELRDALRRHASAAADVSDGLLADVGHIADASGLGVSIEMDHVPFSAAAMEWLAIQSDPAAARLRLATGGDDYEVICAADPSAATNFIDSAASVGVTMTPIGNLTSDAGLQVTVDGTETSTPRMGWTHR